MSDSFSHQHYGCATTSFGSNTKVLLAHNSSSKQETIHNNCKPFFLLYIISDVNHMTVRIFCFSEWSLLLLAVEAFNSTSSLGDEGSLQQFLQSLCNIPASRMRGTDSIPVVVQIFKMSKSEICRLDSIIKHCDL